jgi:two-component sensor histidine kinase
LIRREGLAEAPVFMRFDQSRAAKAHTPDAGAAEPGHLDLEASPTSSGAPIGLRAHLVALVLLVLSPALLLGAATSWQLGQAYRRSAEAGLASTAKALATALDREVEVAAAALATLAASPLLQAGDPAAVYPQAAAVGRAFGGWVALLEPDLRQAFNTLLPLGTELPVGAGGPFVARAMATGEPVVSNLFLGATARRQVVAVFQPLPPGTAGAAPEGRRVLLLAFGPERLSALLERQEPGHPGAFAVLTDGAGRVAARSTEHARFLGQPAPAWYVEGARDRAGGFLQGLSLAGPEMILAFSRLERAPAWTLAVTLPVAAHQAEWQAPMLRFGLGAAAVALVAALLAALLTRRLHQPLRALASDAERLHRGDDVRMVPASGAERIAEFKVLRGALWRSGVALRERATAEGRAAAAEETADELRQAAQRRELLLAELNHRVKNTLATVQSLAAQTLNGTEGDPARFAKHFSARLRTLARAHDLLSEGDWRPADIGIVAHAALAPWLEDADGGRRVVLSPGDGFVVSPRQTQALVLALHELATNATKHGALSRHGGHVELQREIGDDGVATIRWMETGGPPLAGPPARRGFGTRLLERGLAHDLGPGSSVKLCFEAAGLQAVLRFSVTVGAGGDARSPAAAQREVSRG